MKTILHASFESLPFVKTGGLADVLYALPKALDHSKYHVRVILPLLKVIKDRYIYEMESVGHIYVRHGFINEEANVLKYVNEGIEYYFIENDTFFMRNSVYGFDDDAKRFSFYNLAIIETIIQLNWHIDIIHCHDYHLGVLAALCKLRFHNEENIKHIKHVFTIHNLAYQGYFDKQVLFDYLCFDYLEYLNGNLRCNDSANFLKIALVYSDIITTVSETYAQEIQDSEYGYGLENLLRYRRADLYGITNGIDTTVFNPQKDPLIYRNYHKKAYKRNKTLCKRSLQYELGLKDDPNCLVVAVVSRLTFQKGINLILDELQHILNMKVQLVVLGSGELKYEYAFREMEHNYKHQAVFYCGYNEALAHKIYAGADLFLMPSKFEPCGISQLIAMAYGTLPLVRETGGLKDTVSAYNQYTKQGTGFSFKPFSSYDFKQVFDLAYNTYYHHKDDWYTLMENALNQDVSFNKSARAYEKIYEWLSSHDK